VDIKSAHIDPWHRRLRGVIKSKAGFRRTLVLGIIVSFVLMLLLGSSYYTAQLYVSGQVNSYYEVLKQFSGAISAPGITGQHFLRGRLARPERLVVDFKFDDWKQLVEKRNEAVESGSLYVEENPTLPAQIRHNGDVVNVRVRLKGGTAHFTRDKWSFRVEVRDDDKTIFGMKQFSLQHPNTRKDLNEWIVHQLMSRENIIALNYDFVDVIINGRQKGIFAIEEHFSKELVERNERREGPIIVLSEELYNEDQWQGLWMNEIRQVDSYQTSKVEKNEDLSQQFIAARSLIEQFRRSEITTCDVFDCEILAKYFAVLDLVGGQHAASSGNMKMYYNPVTAHIEPIIFDAQTEYERRDTFLQTWMNYDDMPDSTNWIHSIFSDPIFMEMYIRELTRVTKTDYLNTFFSDVSNEMEEKLDILYSSYPSYQYDKQDLYALQGRLREVLEANKALDSYVAGVDGQQISIEVGTVLPMPVLVNGIRCSSGEVRLKQPTRLIPYTPSELITHEMIEIRLPDSFDENSCVAEDFRILYTIPGQNIIKEEAPSLLPREAVNFASEDIMRQRANHSTFNFIRVDERAKRIYILDGQWEVDRTLIIPPGYTLHADSGTTLNLVHKAQIISYSPLHFMGREDSPVVVTSDDSTGNGLVVLNAKEQSNFKYVNFSNLAAPQHGLWGVTGAVTFYESPVNFQHVVFKKNHDSDDALNILRSQFKLEDVLFIDVAADGLDSDFSSGEIINTKVVRAGNDGFDFSGSNVELKNVSINGAGDKGLSIGERSRIIASDVSISNSKVAAVSKDFSDAKIKGLSLNNCDVGVALYQKKPEYGFGKMSIQSMSSHNVKNPYMVEPGSILSINSVVQPTEAGPIADQF
jgi:hypothetical protein